MRLRYPAASAVLMALAAALLIAACGGDRDIDGENPPPPPPPPPPVLQIERSARGVAHITASSIELAAQGLGQAYAEDNFCLLQENVLMVNGERSKVFGEAALSIDRPALVNLESDFFYRFVIDTQQARALLDASATTLALARGYLEGVNGYFARTPAAQIDPACASFARALTLDDMARLYSAKMIRAGSLQFAAGLLAAAPPGAPVVSNATPQATDALQTVPLRPLASNAWAFGRDVVSNGKGLLFGNPHFPWAGTDRLYEARMTVPGQFDVSGVTLPGVPVIGLGYNANVAWTHTVSTARRFTIAELTLAAGDPLSYVVDGVAKPLVAVTIDVPLAPDANGAPQSRRRTYYRSEFGPMVVNPALGLTWSPARAYAFADVNLDNGRAIDTWLAMASVKSVQELRALLERERSVPYFNTLAADDSGEVLYADIGAIPKVERADIERCLPSPGAAALLGAASIVVLDAADASCHWKAAAGAPAGDSLLPAARMPSVIRTDYVLNSNDSYWLTNPFHAFPADLSPILGPVGKAQGMRTRMALQLVGERLGGFDGAPLDKIDADAVATLWGRHDNFAALIVLDDLIAAACPEPLTEACRVLIAWDRTSSLDARGAPLFREIWRRAVKLTPDIWALPFDSSRPINTPRGLKQDDASRTVLTKAVADAAATLLAQGVALNASLREVQGIDAGGRFVPVPGGDEFEGVLNKITATLANGRYTPQHGTSYVQLVTLGGSTATANAKGFLAYSQSTDPRSAHFNDQIEFFSTLSLQPLPDVRARP